MGVKQMKGHSLEGCRWICPLKRARCQLRQGGEVVLLMEKVGILRDDDEKKAN